jgi:hypothetical protein
VIAAIQRRREQYALIPDVEITEFGEQRLDLRFPTGSVSGRVILDEPREGLVVTAVLMVPEGFAREVLASGKPARTLGVAVGEDGAFEVRGLAEGGCRVELRDRSGATVIASQVVTIAGSTYLGDWRPGL